MKRQVVVDNLGKITITDNDFLGAGGQADVYSAKGHALKIYHDPQHMIPQDKFRELNGINSDKVLKPLGIIRDEHNNAIGYSMNLMKGCDPICLLFTRAFQDANNISNTDITAFIGKMQDVVSKVHAANCLIVDLNEMNVLFDLKNGLEPYLIDVDSFQTSKYKATAIMESIRDRQVTNQNWSKGSDWYSFGILAFQLWIGMHPYKGIHPDYTPKDWSLRMDRGVSCLDKKASLPKFCKPLTMIPPSYLEWFKHIFVSNQRVAPPSLDSLNVLTVPVTMNIVHEVAAMFNVTTEFTMPERIKGFFSCYGTEYFIGKDYVYLRNGSPAPVDIIGAQKVLLCDVGSSTPVVAIQRNDKVLFSTLSGIRIGEISSYNMMYRNSCIYTYYNGQCTENSFMSFGQKIVHNTRQVCDVLDNTTKFYNGVGFQNILGKMFVILPYVKGAAYVKVIPELEKYRVLDAYSDKNIMIVIAEKGGSYHRFYFDFNSTHTSYTCRIASKVDYCALNCAVMDTGVVVVALDDEIELYKGKDSKIISNPPFDANNKLFVSKGSLHFVDGKDFKKAEIKKSK